MMFGIGIFIGWFGFGPRHDLFTHWLDLGVISFGFTPSVAKARVAEVAERMRKIKDALPGLVKKVRK